MISITTQQKQFELRVRFSLRGPSTLLRTGIGAGHAIARFLNFSQIRKIEKQKQDLMHDAGLNHWWI